MTCYPQHLLGPYGAVKLFRMLRLNRILNRLERKMSIKYGLWQVIKFTFIVMCSAHWMVGPPPAARRAPAGRPRCGTHSPHPIWKVSDHHH